MGSSETSQPERLYETFHPSERFAELADLILNKLDPRLDEKRTNKQAGGWQDAENSRYELEKHYTSEYLSVPTAKGPVPVETFMLKDFGDDPQNHTPLACYKLVKKNTFFHHIQAVSPSGTPVGPFTGDREAAAKSLAILSREEPREAARSLERKFAMDFEKSVGEYILSHLAVPTVQGEKRVNRAVNAQSASNAINLFVKRMLMIERQVEQKSESDINKGKPHVHAAVVDAINTLPTPGKKGSSYAKVEIVKSVNTVVSKLGGYWHKSLDLAHHKALVEEAKTIIRNQEDT